LQNWRKIARLSFDWCGLYHDRELAATEKGDFCELGQGRWRKSVGPLV